MEFYKNKSHKSGVTEYEVGDDFLVIRFHGGPTYLYNYQSTGRDNIEHMKSLARSGKGLSTFISQKIRNSYAKKLN